MSYCEFPEQINKITRFWDSQAVENCSSNFSNHDDIRSTGRPTVQTHRGSSACRVQDIRMSFNPDSRAVNGKAISKEPINLTTNHKLAHGHKTSAVCTWQMIRTLGSVCQNQVLWESVVKELSIQWTDRHDNFVRSMCWEKRFRPKVLQSGRATDQILPRSDKMFIETGRARASIWHEPLTKLTQNAVWTTRKRELGIRVT